MNRIQAINYLKSSGFSNEQIKAIKGAFTCEDAISRQAVERIINDHRDSISVGGYWGILERMKKLPAVNPLKKVKLGALMCGDEFVSRGETYKVDSVFNGIVVCENVKTGRYKYMDMEIEVGT